MLKIVANDRGGLVMDIAWGLNTLNAKVRSLNANETGDGKAVVTLTLEVRDLNELKTIMSRLSIIKGIIEISRFGG